MKWKNKIEITYMRYFDLRYILCNYSKIDKCLCTLQEMLTQELIRIIHNNEQGLRGRITFQGCM